jgi:glutamate formiminotransferase
MNKDIKYLIRLILREETIGDEQVKIPKGYWTYDKVKQEAEKYNTRGEFSKGSPGAYNSAYREKWLDDVTKHMELYKKPIYWTFDKVKQEAEKYNTRSEFSKGSPSAYNVAYKEKWLDDVTKHMYAPYKGPIRRSSSWAYDKVKQEAEKYNTKAEFFKGSPSAYGVAYRKKWLDDVTSHMEQLKIPSDYWTFDKVKKEAEKYNTKSDFYRGSSGAHRVAKQNNWFDDVTKHMDVVGSIYDRLIYSFEFPDKSVYVGLTYNEKERYRAHMTNIKSSVYRYMKETGLKPIFKKETHYISKVNVVKTGGLGGGKLTWTYDNVKKEAEKYNTKGEFSKGSPGAYNSAYREKWLDDVTKHMELYKKPIYWTFDKVKEEAEKYNTRGEFIKGSPSAYGAAYREKWLDDVTKHMVQKDRIPWGYWTFDKVKQEVEKYNTKNEFRNGSPSAYAAAYREKWLDDFFPKDQR